MTMPPLDLIPITQPLIQADPLARDQTPKDFIDESWFRWISQLVARVITNLLYVASLSRSNQSAAIAATAVHTPNQAGLFAVLWYLKITIADGVASSATVTVSWKDGGNTCSKSFP